MLCQTRTRRGAVPKDAPTMGVTVTFSCSGVDRRRFLDYVAERTPKYGDWSRNWQIQTTGKEDALFSPYLQEPFDPARQAGIIPEDVTSIGGTWGRISDSGEATYLNMVYLKGYDCTDVRDLTRAEIEGRRQALLAIEALRRFAPGFEDARLRNFGMTLGTRDSRKIVGRCVAGDAISHGATRNQMCCAVTGQAAGVAAASLRDGTTTGDVDVAHVQDALRQQGVRLF